MMRKNTSGGADHNSDEGNEHNSQKDSDSKKARFGGLLRDGKGFSSEALKRPLTGLFRKTGKAPTRKRDEEESVEPQIAAPPTNFSNMSRVAATLESVQLDEEYHHIRDQRNSETGSKTTLNGTGPVYGISSVHPLQKYFKVDDIDISSLSRQIPSEIRMDEDAPWTAQSLFNSLEARVRKEKLEAAHQPRGERSTAAPNRRGF